MGKTRRLKLIVSYDGTPFAGWQSQRHGRTIQDEIEKALARICGRHVGVIGAGRTDTGVHALAQCAQADVPNKKFAAARWVTALNGVLPPTIRLLRGRFVPESFHARFSARGKVYRYRIINGPVLPPLEINRAWHVRSALDCALLNQAALLFAGEHDFASFAANRRRPELDTVRTIKGAQIRKRGDLIVIEFVGSGFLYKMVRLMVGAAVECALGKLPLEAIAEWLRHRHRARLAAPAAGLYLMRVLY